MGGQDTSCDKSLSCVQSEVHSDNDFVALEWNAIATVSLVGTGTTWRNTLGKELQGGHMPRSLCAFSPHPEAVRNVSPCASHNTVMLNLPVLLWTPDGRPRVVRTLTLRTEHLSQTVPATKIKARKLRNSSWAGFTYGSPK